MSRQTDTRMQVRALADKLLAEGGTPTPTLIRQLLGKGSPNTIVDELAKWRESRETPSQQLAGAPQRSIHEVVSRLGLEDLGSYLETAESLMQRQSELSRSLADALEVVFALRTNLDTSTTASNELKQTLLADRDAFAVELRKINERFEGVQQYMLLQIDEARTESSRWRSAFIALRERVGSHEEILRARVHGLEAENAWLRGQLGESAQVGSRLPASPLSQLSDDPLATYSGHPLAKASLAEDDEFQR
jgi:hypothetical protein